MPTNYADLGAVQAELGALSPGLTTTSIPSQQDVIDRHIPDIQGDIDGVLSRRGVSVPVIAPTSFLDRLKSLNALGAAARAAAQLFPTDPAAMAYAKWVQDRYDAGLLQLENGQGIPGDATLNSAGGLPRSFATSHPDSVSADLDASPGNTVDPVFRRDTKW